LSGKFDQNHDRRSIVGSDHRH